MEYLKECHRNYYYENRQLINDRVRELKHLKRFGFVNNVVLSDTRDATINFDNDETDEMITILKRESRMKINRHDEFAPKVVSSRRSVSLSFE